MVLDNYFECRVTKTTEGFKLWTCCTEEELTHCFISSNIPDEFKVPEPTTYRQRLKIRTLSRTNYRNYWFLQSFIFSLSRPIWNEDLPSFCMYLDLHIPINNFKNLSTVDCAIFSLAGPTLWKFEIVKLLCSTQMCI